MITIKSDGGNSMKIKIILVMLFLVIFLPLCKKETPTEPVVPIIMLHIEGVVTSTYTDQPISDVKIQLFTASMYSNDVTIYFTTYTDEQGFYSVTYGYQDSCDSLKFKWFKASKDGKEMVMFNEAIRCTEELQIINFQLELEPGAIPLLISPQEGAILDNGRTDGQDNIAWYFQWTAISGATKYHLYVKRTGAQFPRINVVVFYTAFMMSGSGYIANKNRFDWKWKVRMHRNGRWYDWSEERSFDVEPVNTDPSSN